MPLSRATQIPNEEQWQKSTPNKPMNTFAVDGESRVHVITPPKQNNVFDLAGVGDR